MTFKEWIHTNPEYKDRSAGLQVFFDHADNPVYWLEQAYNEGYKEAQELHIREKAALWTHLLSTVQIKPITLPWWKRWWIAWRTKV